MTPDSNLIFAIIGAGQLGSRHLQALCQYPEPVQIYVVDPNAEALAIARSRAEEIVNPEFPPQLFFHHTISEIPEKLDFVIIATSSIVRLEILKELLNHATVANLILEKVTFLSDHEWDEAAAVLKRVKTHTRVNCPRRMNQAYQRLQEIINPSIGTVRMTASGLNWGLACTAIHFIDIFAFLCRSNSYQISTDRLEPCIIDSKRPGYIEILGELSCQFTGGHSLIMQCDESSEPINFLVKIETPQFELIIDEIHNEIEIIRDPGKLLSGLAFKTVFQSALTNIAAEQMISKQENACRLTPFAESRKLHLPMLQALGGFYKNITGEKIARIPIT